MMQSSVLLAADSDTIDAIMHWFDSRRALQEWGGPRFRFPFDSCTFHDDSRWTEIPSYALIDDDSKLLGFGQFYERYSRAHLARIAVNPARRRQGHGRRLVAALVAEGQRVLKLPDCSLFVMKDNAPACELYAGAGFRIHEPPADAPYQAECHFMVREDPSAAAAMTP